MKAAYRVTGAGTAVTENRASTWTVENIPERTLTALALILWVELNRAGPEKMPDAEGLKLIAVNVLNSVQEQAQR